MVQSSSSAKVGPQLPPHILAAREAKRKRLAETAAADARRDQEDNRETKLVSTVATVSQDNVHEDANQSTKNEDTHDAGLPVKKARMIGPSMGPFVGPTRPDVARESSDRRDESKATHPSRYDDDEPVRGTNPEVSGPKPSGSVRDEWMTRPPSKSDWSVKQSDPLQLRPRKFLSGSSASRAGQDADRSWMETEAERKKRVAEEMMGLRRRQDDQPSVGPSLPTERDEELARQVKKYNEQNRGKSLMEQYNEGLAGSSGGKGKEPDDPSRRGFDYEKDIASGGRGMTSSRIQDYVKRASSMDTKFSKGRYL
ncbi:hypothetical protein V1517DRAFT_327045 [Lipomyces orientalis]|uniref:Uncharacterized protein n=1 Tax=Lipomyces orientalis TaxID=1233043 RepID=A0ACC3TKC0_9ASCO